MQKLKNGNSERVTKRKGKSKKAKKKKLKQ